MRYQRQRAALRPREPGRQRQRPRSELVALRRRSSATSDRMGNDSVRRSPLWYVNWLSPEQRSAISAPADGSGAIDSSGGEAGGDHTASTPVRARGGRTRRSMENHPRDPYQAAGQHPSRVHTTTYLSAAATVIFVTVIARPEWYPGWSSLRRAAPYVALISFPSVRKVSSLAARFSGRKGSRATGLNLS
jgi:hypothetical protein